VNQSVIAVQEVMLHCHPTTRCAAISNIRVMLQRLSATQLQLRYRVSGDLAELRIPVIAKAERRDELWRCTCAELFVAAPGHASYVEFNLSPSIGWAAYEFSSYRQDMRAASVAAPVISVKQAGQVLEIDAAVQLPETLAATHTLQASLTMVIEDSAGQYSYWAAHHAAAKPDFHSRESFVVNM
jgi:hypothetical protein